MKDMVLLDTEEQLLKYVRENKDIYIYGGGKVTQLLLKRLERYGIKWKIIITTQGTEMSNGLSTVKFDSISAILQESQPLVIVSTKEMFHAEICRTLTEQRILKIVYISDRLANAMERILNRRFKFQTHLVEHCNLKCRGCYHFSPLAKEEYLSLEEYGNDVRRLGELFNGSLDEIFLLGGEPLLHPQIADFFRVTRKYVPDCQLKILTNGLRLCNMSGDFWRAVREQEVQLWVTKYPVHFDYARAGEVARDHGIELFYFNQEPVRTLGYQPINLKGDRDCIKNWRSCYRANECVDLKHGKIFPCIIPAEIKPFNEYFGVNLQVCEDDYVNIYKVKTAMELLEQLERPMQFCRYCSRENISVFGCRPWSQTTFDIKEWMESNEDDFV